MQETEDPIKRKAKSISWRMMEGDPEEQLVQTGAVNIMPSAAIPHCLPDNVLYQSKGPKRKP